MASKTTDGHWSNNGPDSKQGLLWRSDERSGDLWRDDATTSLCSSGPVLAVESCNSYTTDIRRPISCDMLGHRMGVFPTRPFKNNSAITSRRDLSVARTTRRRSWLEHYSRREP